MVVTHNAHGQSQQQMIEKLANHVAKQDAALLGVQFDEGSVVSGMFFVQDDATSVVTMYRFQINTRADTVTADGPHPWQT